MCQEVVPNWNCLGWARRILSIILKNQECCRLCLLFLMQGRFVCRFLDLYNWGDFPLSVKNIYLNTDYP